MKINKKIILGILFLTLLITLPTTFATDNQTGNLIPTVEPNYTAEELELIHQREIDYENALKNPWAGMEGIPEIELPPEIISDINTTEWDENTKATAELYGYDRINTYDFKTHSFINPQATYTDDMLFMGHNNQFQIRTMEEKIQEIYNENITKFYYNNESAIYAFDADNQTFYHVYNEYTYRPIQNIKNPIYNKSYLISYETNPTLNNIETPTNPPAINHNNTQTANIIGVPQIIGIPDNTPKFNDIKIHIFNAENITITNQEKPFENLTAQITTNNNKTVANLQISLKITRSSNGANKIYNLTTDENGTINLPINLADGLYKIEIYYKDYYKYNNNYKLNQFLIQVSNNTTKIPYWIIKNNTNINMSYGDKDNFTFSLSYFLNPIEKANTRVEFTRLSDNVKKSYYYTNTNLINIPINLNPGAYKVSVYVQETNYKLSTNDILISNPITNKTQTVIKTEEDKSKYYVGTLKTYSGDNLSFKKVDINITRKSDNMSKVYSVLTNEDGYYSLPINLGHGEYTVKCSYNGTNMYSSSQSLEKINC